jgi:hypothetical protein
MPISLVVADNGAVASTTGTQGRCHDDPRLTLPGDCRDHRGGYGAANGPPNL